MQPSVLQKKSDLVEKLRDVPHKPGVYLMKDRLNRIIYVGKARDLRKRLGQHFMPSRRANADLKTRALLDSVWDFEIHLVRNEPEALLLEGKLIKDFRPKYNISFRDDKRFLLVKVNLSDPIPRFQLTRLKKDDGCRYFGPFAHAGALRSTLSWMRKRFGIRSCRTPEPGEQDYRRCLDHIIKNCSAPCIRKVSLEEYQQRVLQACEFLDGESRELLEQLEAEMKSAAEKLDFERAAQIRNMLEDLRRTTKPTRRFTRGSLPSTVDPAADLQALADALLLPRPPRIMECFDISNISTTHVVASMVCFKDGVPDKSNYRRYRIRTVEGQDDFASMAEVVRRRYSRILLETKAIAADLSEFNQEPVEDAVKRAQSLDKLETSPLDRLESGSLDKLETDSLDKLETEAVEELETGPLAELETDAPDELEIKTPEKPKSGPERLVRLPDLIIVDGGKGQLNAACRELQRLGLNERPIIGLAKEFEEIYRPSRPLPVRLPEDSGALQLLQRIRDEAHRFANGYHQLLMKKRIAESILDECPGVSDSRKQALLAKFGSVERLRKAPIEDIAAVDGISNKLAETIWRFLNR
ncbi:MAG TPA: excinuclease ABC subunit UvrC [Chthoniobacterales bacterium]|nr:excinuclease ABC subunit UvrC [Chthoniobacterales bacterium]